MSETVAKKKGRPAKDKSKKHPHCFDFRRPTEDQKGLIDLWKSFQDGKLLDPNKGIMTAKQFGDAIRDGGSVPPLYSPIRRLIAARTNATCIVSGQTGEKPLARHDVPAKLADTFGEKDRVYTNSDRDPVFLRLCHAADARKLVVDRDENVLTINRNDYVVGTPDKSAVFLINGSKTGVYGKNLAAAKEIAFKEMESELANLVGRFNSSPTILKLDDGGDGIPMAVHEYYFVTWGYMERGDRKMTPAQIRAAVEKGETDGMKFVELETPILSNPVRESELSRREGTNWDDLIAVQTRTLPIETYPFGMFSGQTGVVPFTHYNETSNADELEMVLSFAVGDHCGASYSETFWEAAARLTPEGEEVKKTEKKSEKKARTPKTPKAAAPKAPKAPKSGKSKSPAKKSGSKKKPAAVSQDAGEAAPVEHTVTDVAATVDENSAEPVTV